MRRQRRTSFPQSCRDGIDATAKLLLDELSALCEYERSRRDGLAELLRSDEKTIGTSLTCDIQNIVREVKKELVFHYGFSR